MDKYKHLEETSERSGGRVEQQVIKSAGLDGTHLVLSGVLHYLFIDNLIHDLETFDGFLLRDADISLLQWHGAETAEKKSHQR